MKIRQNVLMGKFTTFHIGVMARYYAEVENGEELYEISDFVKNNNLRIFVLGEGSDILVGDNGINGLVVSYKERSLKIGEQKDDSVLITAGAGMSWDNLVKESVSRKLQGIECMSGIYGSVGAAPIQNIGAYGQELKDTFVCLNAFEIDKKRFIRFSKEQCKFGYRDSIFKTKKYWQKYIITDITLKLNKTEKPQIKYDSLIKFIQEKKLNNPSLLQVRNAVLEIRSDKFENPKVLGNAGSFFKNPILSKNDFKNISKKFPEIPFIAENNGTFKTFAGWYIENAGLKGKKYRNAQISSKHALILLNTGNAKAEEITRLADIVIREVYKKYKVTLETEVQYIGIKDQYSISY